MSRIEFEQISDDIIEVIIPPETPMEMVQQLTKSFIARGLVEDLQKSTLSVRYFYRPEDKVNDLADKLIKSLQSLSKDELPYWHPKAQMANQKRVREMNTAEGTGKRYAYIRDPVKKEDDEDDVEKSNYGPKKAGLYNPADNAKRKANNMDPVEGIGPNTNAKSYSSKPGQLSGKQSVDLTARIQNKANKKQPVKRLTPEEIATQYNPDGTLKKSWGQHLPFPSAEEEIMRLAKAQPLEDGESAAANQLAALMAGKSMLGKNTPPAIKAMFAAPPAQPTNEQMFGHLVVTEDMEKANQEKWNQGAFGWLAEATKPITQKFASEAEELAYWDSIKVSDRDDGKSGY